MGQPTFEDFVKSYFDESKLKGEYLTRVCTPQLYEKMRQRYHGHDVSVNLAELFEKRESVLNRNDKVEMFAFGYPLLRAMYDSLFRYVPDVYDQVGSDAPWERGDD